jgi:hypothetical protein
MRKLWVGWLILWVFSGCGYHFSGEGSLPKGVNRVFVVMLENRTEETGIESLLTNDLIYEFSRGGTLAMGENRADARLTGVIESITKGTIARAAINTSLERRVYLTLSLRLTNREGQVCWSAKQLSENETYLVESDREITDRNRRAAIEKLSKRLAQKIYYRLTDNF